MDLSRIATLLQPFVERETLSETQLQQISTYIDLLLRWNARINLTAIRDPEEIVRRHFGESLFLARHVLPRTNSSSDQDHESTPPTPDRPLHVLDLGSGAGFPGLPLKIWAPSIFLTLVESNHKKATFLREITRSLTLMNVNVINSRAETLSPAHPVDIVTLRAVEHFHTILPVAARLLSPTGRLAILIGSSQLPAMQTLTPTLTWSSPIPIPESTSRVLLISVPRLIVGN
jgi:16S rRNA (guanine527-N7)-methyltransferase